MAFFGILALLLAGYILCMPLILWARQSRLQRQLGQLEELLANLQPAPHPEPKKKPRTAVRAEAAKSETLLVEPPLLGPEITPLQTEEALSPAPENLRPELPQEPEKSVAPPLAPEPEEIATVSQPGPTTPARPTMEEALTSRWLIWVGALAVALSAVFLFRHAVEQGWLTPMTRVVLGLLLGGALLAAGEYTMRHPVEALRRALKVDFVPTALSGSGIFAIYLSLYAAHAMFGLLSPATAFVALGLVSYSALALSLRQGPFVALVGMIAGYLVPALVIAPVSQALPVFLYLFVLSVGCIAVMVWRKWVWFAFLTIAGATIWPILWLAGAWTIADQGVLSAYVLGLALVFAAFSTNLPLTLPERPLHQWLARGLLASSGIGFAVSGFLLLILAGAADFNGAAFAFVGLYAGAALVLAAWRPRLEVLLPTAATIALAIIVLWRVPFQATQSIDVNDIYAAGFGPFMVPPEYVAFSYALWGFSLLFGVGAWLGMQRGRTPALWAGLSVLMPLLFLVIGYWRIGALRTDISWAGLAAALAVLATGAATLTRRRSDRQGELATAFYAAGATFALALAFACVLREAWLTVALAAETLALAWIWSRMQLHELRQIVAVLVGIIILRLVANPAILDYQGGVPGLFGWVVYGYGLPALTIFLAARILGRGGADAVTTLCEIAAAGFAFLMVALQLKLWTSGALFTPHWRLFDQAVQSLWWITAAALLLAEARRGKRPWTRIAGTGLLFLSLASVIFGHVLMKSPLMNREPVGFLPLLNLLGLAYLVPAVLYSGMARSARLALSEQSRRILQLVSGMLVFVYITLETRRAFWGVMIYLDNATRPSDAEFYAYSAVWILFALGLLALGIRHASGPLRYASLAVLMAAVAKVFLFDMSDLSGLFRVASFLGLGLTLITIGRIYQRFVFPPPDRKSHTAEAGATISSRKS